MRKPLFLFAWIIFSVSVYGNSTYLGWGSDYRTHNFLIIAGLSGVILEPLIIYYLLKYLVGTDRKIIPFTVGINALTLFVVALLFPYLDLFVEIMPPLLEFFLLKFCLQRYYKKQNIGRVLLLAVFIANAASFFIALLINSLFPPQPYDVEEELRRLAESMNISVSEIKGISD